MAAKPQVFLVFEGAWHEVESSVLERRGCLRAFAREAERKWDLQPSTYEFQHASGKVDSCEALKRALESAEHGTCKIDIVERFEGKMMRNMRKEMKLMEDRVMAKVGSALADMREATHFNETRLSGAVAPLLQCLATEQMELRSKLGQLDIEVSEVVHSQKASESDSIARSLKDADALEEELQQDMECAMQTALDLELSCADSSEKLREEVCQLGQKTTIEADQAPAAKISSPEVRGATVDFKHAFGEPDSRLQWPTSAVSGFAYSSKIGQAPWCGTGLEARWKAGEDVATPFAHSYIASQRHFSKSMFGHRSCPLLPPLQ